ncbi:MAG TPA: hypothetical protein VN958_13880, partial [Chitinophagaceae bacterium]|nr:hypothetical protein [Chitinophagaceae bacterium]
PNNNDSGCFENLLLHLIQPNKQNIIECFDFYCNCIHQSNPNVDIPIKSKVFAFLEATNQSLKIGKVDFLNTEFWDLTHTELEPLKNFLKIAVTTR